jgi:hypothetical protein
MNINQTLRSMAIAAAAVAAFGMAGAVNASPIFAIQTTTAPSSNPQAAFDAQAAFLAQMTDVITEDFEGDMFSSLDMSASFSTQVGTFTATGAPGDSSNSRCIPSSGTTCDQMLILNQDDSPFTGRYNTTAGGSQWLDSNDVSQLTLNIIDPGFAVNAFGFFVTDATDQGASFRVQFNDGTVVEQLLSVSGLSTGDHTYVSFRSTESIVAASILFENFGGSNVTRDGFGIDDVTIGHIVPEPSIIALFGLGLLGFGMMASVRRRRGAMAG